MKNFIALLFLNLSFFSAKSLAAFDPIALLAELKAAGITVVMDYGAINTLSREQYRTYLESFLPNLEINKTRFIRNKHNYNRIILRDFSFYDSKNKLLSLDIRMNSNDIVGYVATNSRRISLERQLKMKFNFGNEVLVEETNKLGRFFGLVNKIQAKKESIQKLSPLITAIRLSKKNEIIPSQAYLEVDENTFETSIDAWSEGLAPMAQFMAAAKSKQVEFPVIEFQQNPYYWNFVETGKRLLALQSKLEPYFNNPIKAFVFKQGPTTSWSGRYQLISISLSSTSIVKLESFIDALIPALANTKNLKINLIAEQDLSENEFIVCSERLRRFYSGVSHRRYAINVFQFGKVSSWDARTGTFTVGAEPTDEAFQAVLKALPGL